ncbi:MAG TPA: sensor histidine kinase [Acidimicrobiales bacterium]|nr:sensor histidine kinase [Acidimicrobiales bacterium]
MTPNVPEPPDAGGPSAADTEAVLQRARWATGWRRLVFPGVFLVYLAQTGHGISVHTSGVATAAGVAVLALFATAYVRAVPETMRTPSPRFWWLFAAMLVLFVAELPFAHQDAFVMVTYIVVLSLSALGRRAVPIIVVLVALAMFMPPLVPSWHASVDLDAAVTISLVALAMYGFFEIIRSNRALTEARAEVARLAAESERTRIARDLHDLLGHSLTTITVKAGLARRLGTADPERAVREIGEVEDLARRALGDVRTAVAGYREVGLASELASGRELLRAVGIVADLPASGEVVRSDLHELFGWVVREGLTNVVRHSRARRCVVTLTSDSVEIADDGGAPATTADGSGLRGLRERVAAAGGTLQAGPTGSGVRGGWRLQVTVPQPAATPPAADCAREVRR